MYSFRSIHSSDYSTILDLGKKLFHKEEIPDLQKALSSFVPELSYVAFENASSHLIGFTLVCNKQTTVIWKYLDVMPNGLEIAFIGISPFFQGKGIGSKLLHHTLYSIFQSYPLCWLSVDIHNSSAIQMYQKFGFRKWTFISHLTYPYISIPNYIMGLSSKKYLKLFHPSHTPLPIG
jgi:ribosomal protein S18 acetylase RimI-like enzyme